MDDTPMPVRLENFWLQHVEISNLSLPAGKLSREPLSGNLAISKVKGPARLGMMSVSVTK
jgi:hypothetical protein